MEELRSPNLLGALVRAERKAQKLTQEELASLAGVGARFLRELEAGKASCQIGLGLDVLHALGLDLFAARRGDRP